MSSSAYQSLPVPLRVASWVVRVIVAIILLQTLFFKFSGAPESVYIFETVGQEPWGRYGSGVVELIAAVLLFVPALVPVGAVISLGVISGAIFFHLTKLGIVVQDDGGLLFGLAVVVFFGSAFIAWIHRHDLPVIGSKL
ncbi:DoxX family protein [Rariglobus hedericola]|uniref:DoxX family protein n=1 Tax=Rariglobus hedericola TaxID=2597822 RepID=A0A556QPF7_9BACT|nr:DoxX family protein [Rariglobus hedericola]TSJ78482.1 DoxX family protein [Rariglobus hedericola]